MPAAAALFLSFIARKESAVRDASTAVSQTLTSKVLSPLSFSRPGFVTLKSATVFFWRYSADTLSLHVTKATIATIFLSGSERLTPTESHPFVGPTV